MADLRAAIVGYGLAGSVFHGPLIEATPGLVVGAVVSGNPERRDQAAQAHPGAGLLDDADQLFERAGDYDFAVIAAPNRVHAPLARRALDAGLPVVVDKPMATSAAEARELVEHAERSGLLLTVFLNRRWDSDHLTLRRLLAEDKLGNVLRYESRFERWRPALAEGGTWREETPPEEGGGVLLDIGSHLVDQALMLFGPVSEINAEVEARRGGAADDDSFLALRHASGTYSHLSASLLAAAPGPRLRVLGDRAAYVVEALDGQEAALRAGARPRQGGEWGVEPPENWGRLATGRHSEPVPSEPGDWPSFYTGLGRALHMGSQPPVDPGDAVAGLEIIEAARQVN